MNSNNEILERVLLMMKYDSSKTLKENSDVVKKEFAEQLNEAPRFKAKTKAKLKPKTTVKTTPGGLTTTQIKAQTATYAKTPLSNGALPTPQQQIAYAKKLAAGKTVTVNTPANSKVTITPQKRTKIKKIATPKETGMIAKLKKSFSRANWKSALTWALGIGGVSAVVWYVFLRDVVKVSPCLLDSLTEEEVGQLNGGTTGTITRTQVGNRTADINGGLVFQLDHNGVTTGNGKYKGTYSCDGNNIKVDIAGSVFTIGGGSSTDNGTGNTNNGGGGQSKYTQCPETFPIAMNCKNSTIARVQGCIGVTQDGAFGPITSQALVAKGVDGQSITQDSLNKVCGGQVVKQSAPGTDAEEDDAGGGNLIATTSKGSVSDDADEA